MVHLLCVVHCHLQNVDAANHTCENDSALTSVLQLSHWTGWNSSAGSNTGALLIILARRHRICNYTDYMEYREYIENTEYTAALYRLFLSPASPLLWFFCNWEFEPLIRSNGAVDDKHRPVLTKKFYVKNSFIDSFTYLPFSKRILKLSKNSEVYIKSCWMQPVGFGNSALSCFNNQWYLSMFCWEIGFKEK